MRSHCDCLSIPTCRELVACSFMGRALTGESIKRGCVPSEQWLPSEVNMLLRMLLRLQLRVHRSPASPACSLGLCSCGNA